MSDDITYNLCVDKSTANRAFITGTIKFKVSGGFVTRGLETHGGGFRNVLTSNSIDIPYSVNGNEVTLTLDKIDMNGRYVLMNVRYLREGSTSSYTSDQWQFRYDFATSEIYTWGVKVYTPDWATQIGPTSSKVNVPTCS